MGYKRRWSLGVPFRKLCNFLKDGKLLPAAIFSVICVLSITNCFGQPAAPPGGNASPHFFPQGLSLKPSATKLSPWEEKYSSNPYIIIFDEQETILNQDWSTDVTQHLMIKIQREDTKRWSEIPVYYDKSREVIESVNAKVISPDGKIQKAEKMEDSDVYAGFAMYGDLRVKKVSLPQTVYGSIIDLTIKKKINSGSVPGQFWEFVTFPRSPTKSFKSVYVFPLDKKIEFKDYKRSSPPTISQDTATVRYAFELSETQELTREEYSPPDYEMNGFAMFSSMRDWKVLADWVQGQIQKKSGDDAALTEKTKILVQGKTSQREKAMAVLEFLQDSFRYVPRILKEGAGDFHSVGETFRNQYADSQDWALLARKMLMVAGVQSNVCLSAGEFDGSLQNSFPNLTIFNQAVLEILVDGQKYFVDPLLRGYDLGQFPLDRQGARLLVIEEGGYRLDQLKIVSEEENSIESHTDVFITEDGSAVVEITSRWGVDVSVPIKEQWLSLGKDKEKFYNILDDGMTRGLKVSDRVWDGLDNRYGGLVSTLRYKRPQPYLLLNDSMVLAETPQVRPPAFSKNTRVNPIFFPQNSIVKSVITYHFPKGFGVDFVPTGYDVKNEGMEISKSFVASGETVEMTDIYRVKRAMFPPERYQEFVQMWDEIGKKNNQFVILKKMSQ